MAVPHNRLVAIVEAIHRLALASEVEGEGEVAVRGLEDLLCPGGADRDRQRKEHGEDKRTWFHDCLYIMVYKMWPKAMRRLQGNGRSRSSNDF